MTGPERCPVCRAAIKAETTCRRCQADVGVLFAIDREARLLLGGAVRLLGAGDRAAAKAAADRSILLRSTPLAAVIERFIASENF